MTASRFWTVIFLTLVICFIIFWPRDGRGSSLHSLSTHDHELHSSKTLAPRDTYACGPGRACNNGACCSSSGYCGYGSAYCGTGCTSNCDAHAECGQYAPNSTQECPLKTCCSEFGFCGTTADFCGTGCQSNCVLDPKPSPVKASIQVLDNKVIGYYEAWNSRSSCHKVAPTDLPIDALTHLNFAFSSIDENLEVITMDAETPTTLFSDVTNLKAIKPDLKVFISIGGWSFSDNGTATQPLFGEIAADVGKRQTFATNVLRFMQQYGFDGLDIDWEYPGVPDRGGNPEDTDNYVQLLKTLREMFDASGKRYGLTFTAPSSYWYLRWFDIANMVKHADWINYMSYDLHGSWDASSSIGSIVQGHTNLTEIKLAAELFWRAGVPPDQIVMGVGFYGRSFTLSDPSCTTVGCAFSAAGRPGPCTATAGILAFYELQEILNGNGSISPTWDKKDAVKYMTFDEDQWVSFDDATSFQQKLEWANSVGLGGVLIWASDLDDAQFTAHSDLLGRNITSTSDLQLLENALSNPQSVIQNLAGSNGQTCFVYSGSCVNLNDNNAMAQACGSGFTVVGWDDAGCGKKKCHCGKPICCPIASAPKNCIWRGDNNGQGVKSDCDAQCLPGETNIMGISSSWGGGFQNDGNTNKCGRGFKAFCCPNPDASQITEGCGYQKCTSDCPSDTTEMFRDYDSCVSGSKPWCCPTDDLRLKDCRWESGSGLDCANAVCSPTELEVSRSHQGFSSTFCVSTYGRQKAACCTVQQASPPPATCSADLCELISGLCTDDDDAGSTSSRRALSYNNETHDGNSSPLQLVPRANPKYTAALPNGFVLVIVAATYPAIGSLYQGARGSDVLRRYFRLIPGFCIGPAVQEGTVAPGPDPPLLGFETEHPIDRQVVARFIEAASSGFFRGINPVGLPTVDSSFFQNYWNHEFHALGNRPAVGGPHGAKPSTPNNRMMEAFGSSHWTMPLLPCDKAINQAKGNLMDLKQPIDWDTIEDLAELVVQLDTPQAVDNLLSSVRIVFAIFEYLNEHDVALRFNAVRLEILIQLGYIEQDGGAPGLQAWWDPFLNDYLLQVENWARTWTEDAIHAALGPIQIAQNDDRPPIHAAQVEATLLAWLELIETAFQFPPYIGAMQWPGSSGGSGGT